MAVDVRQAKELGGLNYLLLVRAVNGWRRRAKSWCLPNVVNWSTWRRHDCVHEGMARKRLKEVVIDAGQLVLGKSQLLFGLLYVDTYLAFVSVMPRCQSTPVTAAS